MKLFKISQLATLCAVSCAVSVFISCGGSSSSNNSNGGAPRPQDQGNALVRIINASPDTAAVDLLIRDDKVDESVGYLVDTEYHSVDAGSATFTVRDSGGFTTIADSSRSFTKQKQYTIFVLGSLGTRRADVVEDINDDPGGDRVRVRFVNADPNSKGIDVYITAPDADIGVLDPAFENVSRLKVTEYLEADEGVFVLRITDKGSKRVIAESEQFQFEGGSVRTTVFALTGGASPTAIVALNDKE